MSSNIEVKLDVLNQKGSPALFADSLASRPAASFAGRLFVDTDNPSTGIYRDTGTSWIQVADETGTIPTPTLQTVTTAGNTSNVGISISANGIGIGTAIPASNRLDIHTATGINATFNGTGTTNSALQLQSAGVGKWTIQNNYNSAANDFVVTDVLNTINRLIITNTGVATLTASLSATKTATYSSGGVYGIYGNDNYTIPASTSFGSGGLIFASLQGVQNFTYGGNATYDNSALNGSVVGINQIQFSSTGTITMTQATGVRAMSSGMFQNQFLGATNGTITHLAGIEVLGVYKASTGIATITNAYGLLINNIDDYTSGFAFTNRWGIYQDGASDNNYFAGKIITGSTTVSTYQLDVTGSFRAVGNSPIFSTTDGSGLTVNNTNANRYSNFQINWNSIAQGSLFYDNSTTRFCLNTFPSIPLALFAGNPNPSTNQFLLFTTGNVVIGSGTDAGFRLDVQNGPSRFGNNLTVTGTCTLSGIVNVNGASQSVSGLNTNRFCASTDAMIGTGAAPDASAVLELRATTKGLLFPRMTTAQKNAISTPATGLVVYDTTLNKLALYTGAAWETVTSI